MDLTTLVKRKGHFTHTKSCNNRNGVKVAQLLEIVFVFLTFCAMRLTLKAVHFHAFVPVRHLYYNSVLELSIRPWCVMCGA
jgi:hypothetical protein